jgi:Tfp pilus assembly protein PilV
MKTKLIGLLAIVVAISASAFTTPKTSHAKINYVWFSISTSTTILPGAAVPEADATYMNTGAAPTSNDGCSTSDSYQCVSGFTSTQVNGEQLKDNNQVPPETPYRHD